LLAFCYFFTFWSARLPFSEAQKRAILDWAREIGMKDVPSLYSIKKWQEKIEKNVGHPTEKVTSLAGNVFYMNNIGKAIAMVSEMIWNQVCTDKQTQPT